MPCLRRQSVRISLWAAHLRKLQGKRSSSEIPPIEMCAYFSTNKFRFCFVYLVVLLQSAFTNSNEGEKNEIERRKRFPVLLFLFAGILQTLSPKQQEVHLFRATEVSHEPLTEKTLSFLPLPKVFSGRNEERRYTSQPCTPKQKLSHIGINDFGIALGSQVLLSH